MTAANGNGEASDGASGRVGAFYGRRKGHALRPHRAALLAGLLPRLALDLTQPPPVPLAALFPVPVESVRLEIGFGAGEHLVAEARAFPRCGFLGCEPFVNGMAGALAAIAAVGLDNIRLHHGDAVAVLDWLPDSALAGVDLLYPDPWPKRRHWKRRFVRADNIARLARVLAPGADFRFATDWPDYAAWTLERLTASADFAWTAEHPAGWRLPWPGYAATRYEAKARAEGRTPYYLTFRRVI